MRRVKVQEKEEETTFRNRTNILIVNEAQELKVKIESYADPWGTNGSHLMLAERQYNNALWDLSEGPEIKSYINP